MVWITESLSFINCTRQFKMKGPNVKIGSKISRGPAIVGIKVINHSDLLNHLSNHPC